MILRTFLECFLKKILRDLKKVLRKIEGKFWDWGEITSDRYFIRTKSFLCGNLKKNLKKSRKKILRRKKIT